MKRENQSEHCISIHALLAESDCIRGDVSYSIIAFLSTLSLRRATASSRAEQPGQRISIHALLAESDSRRYPAILGRAISIHALLAESDSGAISCSICSSNFYPRSPCGERPLQHSASCSCHSISIHALLAESDNRQPIFPWRAE